MTASAAQKPSLQPMIGQSAPDFAMQAADNKTVSLESLKGKKIVLYFYPKDDTPGCTQQAKDFRDHLEEFEAANTVVLGVSKDTIESHEKFRKKFSLPFALLSDESGAACDAYSVWVEKSMYGKTYMGIERATYLIDKNGIIRNIWRKVKVDNHIKEVLDAAKAL